MQLYYYMQKLQTAGMGNPKERKECPICGKTLYDRSTWNRHMRIHTGKFNPEKKSSFMIVNFVQVKNRTHVGTVAGDFVPTTTSSAMKRSAPIDMPGLSSSQPRQKARV